MKHQTIKTILTLFIFTILLSCTTNDESIYVNDSNNVVHKAIRVDYSAIETEILSLVNNHREQIGLSKLQLLNIVSKVADTHTSYMIEKEMVSHDNFPVRLKNLMTSVKAKSVGENVAYGFQSAKGVLNGWLNSESHRKIIEDSKFTHFGISTKSNTAGRNYFTHIFIVK